MNFRKIIICLAALLTATGAFAQVEKRPAACGKRSERDKKENQSGPKVSDPYAGFFKTTEPHDADLSYMRQIYRQIDLTKDANTPLYFPEDVIDGQENLFRIILPLVVDGQVPGIRISRRGKSLPTNTGEHSRHA